MTRPKTPPIRLAQSVLDIWQPEAASMGVSTPRLIATDLRRYRMLADAAVPPLTDWQWGLLSHVLDGIEAHRILTGVDDLPSASTVAAEIDTWADGATDDDALRAGELRRQVATWSPLAIAGVLFRLRGQCRNPSRRSAAS